MTEFEREKGVQAHACPVCGTNLLAVEQADGGVAYETCQTCAGTTEKASEAEPAVPAVPRPDQAPTEDRAVGTDVPPAKEK